MTAADTLAAAACPVCGSPLGPPLYDHPGPTSITSLAQAIPAGTKVFLCGACGHASSAVLERVGEYYDTHYNILTETDAADDLYETRGGKPVYRAAHQAEVALARLDLPRGARVLDYGCAKAASLRDMLRARPDLAPFVFDVSKNYTAFWDHFVPPENQASYIVPTVWHGTMDAVVSFFVTEHVADPRAFVRTLVELLKPGGRLHLVFPNVRRNPGDLIVADHVNHFMPSSIAYVMSQAGATDVRIDEEAHAAAYVVNATRAHQPAPAALPAPAVVAPYVRELEETAAFWRAARSRIAQFETEVRGKSAVIYGSNFYGVFIATSLADTSAVECFLDQNPFQRAKRPLGIEVRAPDTIGDRAEVVYVGLNPKCAKEIIASVDALRARQRLFFYL